VRRSIVAAAAIVLTLPVEAHSQIAGALDVGSGVGSGASESWMRESRLSPALRLFSRHGYLHADAALVERAGTLRLTQSNFDAAGVSPAFGAFRFSLDVRATQDSATDIPAWKNTATAALSAARGRGGAWLGTSIVDRSGAALVGGVWRALGSAIVSLSSGRQATTIHGFEYRERDVVTDSVWSDSGWVAIPGYRETDTVAVSRLRRWQDVEARVDWAAGRWMISAVMGGRGSADSTRAHMWGRVTTGVRINPRVAVIAGAGTTPKAMGSLVPQPARYVTLGVRLSPAAFMRAPLPAAVHPAATRFALAPVSDGVYRITMRVPSARTVEISGDFNRWTAIALREVSPNVWEVTVALQPGTHHIGVRVDGDRWTAPPGLPSVNDEFNGRVGIIVVQ
jgi:Glycogen recognition site of AMP-activated protein kinase